MDLSSSGLRDRLGSLSKPDLSPTRKDDNCNKPLDTVDVPGCQFVQRCVIVQRDEKGYGLTVSGDNPVFVQSVKEDGAAARAGVQQGDRIIKVNGNLVTQSNHVEVVKLIKSGSYVALTLLGRALATCPRSPAMQQHIFPVSPPMIPQQNSMSATCHKPTSPTDRITGPQPVDHEKQQQLSFSKNHTLRMMLEQELSYRDGLRNEFARTGDEKLKSKLTGACKRIKTLEEQLLSNATPVRHDSGLSSHSLRSPPMSRTNADFNSKTQENSEPPSLPPRRYPLPHQSSLPNVTVSNTLDLKNQSYTNEQYSDTSSGPPCLTRPNHSESNQRFPTSNSVENIQRSNAMMTTAFTTTITTTTSSTMQSTTSWITGGPTHSRQRSSPDALLHQTETLRQQRPENNWNCNQDLSRSHSEITATRKFMTSDSFSDGDNPQRRKGKGMGKGGTARASSFGTYDNTVDSPRVTPPGTPPPPYGSSETVESSEQQEETHMEDKLGTPTDNSFCPGLITSNNQSGLQHDIMSMEDDDAMSDSEPGSNEEHGPFNSLPILRRNPAHMCVFLYYLISNSDPASLFFYLITDLYRKGNAKEMKKWAYEIHSSFLVPNAPLKISYVDENALHEIDRVLQNDLDKEEILRKVFWKARRKAIEEINEFLEDFCNKRTLGLATLFGPPDEKLDESLHDKAKELKIIEGLLLPCLTELAADIENCASNKTCAIASSLATVMYKWFGVKSQQSLSIIERCPVFVNKEKSRLKFLNRNKKPHLMKGHHFIPQHYFNVTYCNHCQLIIWGVGNQGYQCQNCEMNIHKTCVKVVEETCIGAMRNKKDKKKDRRSGIMENIIGKMKPVPPNSSNRRFQDEIDGSGSTFYGPSDGGDDSDRSNPPSRVEKLKNRYETLSENDEKASTMSPHPLNSTNRELMPQTNSSVVEPSTNGDSGKKGASIGRSESLRTRREHQRHSFRKRSDPNIPQSKSDAEDTTGSSLHPSASSSSCSSSTRSLDSPSNSLEAVSRQATIEGSPIPVGNPINSIPLRIDEWNDSDLEAEADPPNWTDFVDRETVRYMKPKERKRQEVINELFHTERTHVRNLKILERFFYRPMLQEQVWSLDQIKLLFANLEDMLELHGRFNSMMKACKTENVIVGDIGRLMLDMFDGQAGENLREAAALFCKDQSFALESLKSKQKKDQKLAQFLTDVESNPLCRRLQLKDFIPTGMQRLTKYPLLLENLAKYTPPNTEEYLNVMRAVDCCKENLNYVNQMVKETENLNRLRELQKRLDRGSFDKLDHPIAQEFRSLDLTKYTMIHEGPLTWRINRQKAIDLQVLLLDSMIVLLHKQDEKYVLKFHKEETKMTHSPIIKFNNLLVRNVAVDKKAFFIVITSNVGPQIYELVAISSADRTTWIRVISETVESYKTKDGKSKEPEVPMSSAERSEPPSDDVLVDQEKNRNQLEIQDNQEISETEDNSDHSENHENGDDACKLSDMQAEGEENGSSASSSPEKILDGATASSLSMPSLPCSGTNSTNSSSNSLTMPNPPAPKSHLLRAEVSQAAESPMLIEPSEVIVSQTAVLELAEPVLTPLEKLRRKDTIIHHELQEKQNLIAEILHIPKGEYDNITDMASQLEGGKDARDVVLAAIDTATQLTKIINESLTLGEEDAIAATSDAAVDIEETSELSGATALKDINSNCTEPKVPSPALSRRNRIPSAPVHKLIGISDSLQQHLTHLLSVISDREDERDRMRKELRLSREQIHSLHQSRQQMPTFQSPNENTVTSRPNSFISVSSSATSDCSDPCDVHHFEEADSDKCSSIPEEDLKTPTREDTPLDMQIEMFNQFESVAKEPSDSVNYSTDTLPLETKTDINVDNNEQAFPDAGVNKISDADSPIYHASF